MNPGLTGKEKDLIRAGIREKYSRVAAAGALAYFKYPTGAAGLEQQHYPPDIIRDFPPALIDSFCGVGNPFSLGPIHPGDAILDLGCGAGLDALVAARLAGPAGKVAGIDLTPAMIAKAREYAAALGLTNAAFQEGEIVSLPFPDNSFDVVISNGVLNLTLDKGRAFKEAHRVLKPGGRLQVADMVLTGEPQPGPADRIDNWRQ